MLRSTLSLAAGLALAVCPALARAEGLVLDDPLNGASSGTVSGGTFLAGGGWKVTGLEDHLYWHVGAIVHGAVEFSVSGINPNECRDTMNSKSELFHLYDSTYDNSDTSYSGYRNNPFKHFLRKTNCTDWIPARIDSMEVVFAFGGAATEADTPVLSWDPATTYRFREEWGPDGQGNAVLRITRDGAEVLTLTVPASGAPGDLSVRLAASGRATVNEEAALDAVYSNVQVWDLGTPGPDAGVDGPDAGGLALDPVDDTFAAPLEPALAHGDQEAVQVGGDGAGAVGRTIYFKFDLGGLSGSVAEARLHVKATNGGGGGAIAAVADTAWTEEALTWDNRPAVTGSPLSSLGAVTAGTEYTWDVAPGLTVGGLRSFAVTSVEGDGAAYGSKENADPALRPYLELVLGPALPPDAGAPAGPDAEALPGADAATIVPGDASAADGGMPVGTDAGAKGADGGGTPPGPSEDGACGCASGGSGVGMLAMATALLALGYKRRSRS